MARTGKIGSARRWTVAAALALGTGGVLAVSGVAGTGEPGGTPAAAAFRLADGSAACNYADGTLVCRADGMEGAVVLEPDGSQHGAEASTVAWDQSTPVLLPSESWWNGDVACRAGERELSCTAADGELHLAAAGAGGASSTTEP
jgi:hypothetical protein